MKTVLIVEDEKMIRQGIKTMVQRSGVPVEVIIECSNGEAALEILREQRIDVMFTDIRMPKMDGIELVQRMQECESVPLTVAISGYDDFSYAVEMLRNGVREYILKPIERGKIVEILRKLNAELEERQAEEQVNRKLGYQQMKHMMLLEHMTEEEMQTLESQYEKDFYQEIYVLCCQNAAERGEPGNEDYICLKEIEGNDVFIVKKCALEPLLETELKNGFTGVSGEHQGLRELHKAYEEALAMRKRAFCRGERVASFGTLEHIPEKLIMEAEKLLGEEAGLQRVQLLGTDRREEMEKAWQRLFSETEKGRIAPEKFETAVREFFGETAKIYRNVIGENTEIFQFCNPFREDSLSLYKEKVMEWLREMQEGINNQTNASQNSRKIQQAVEYIEANYAKDLNMAVVSNHISMNYSLFSYSFKQYTGNNFVNFLKEIRMREAKRLLADSDMRINEISQAVGYENEKHFMKMFRTSCGVSPSEYRKNMRQE